MRAERRIVQNLLDDFHQVHDKTRILFRIAVAALENPDGAVRDVIFPVADATVCKNLVKERDVGGLERNRQVHTIIITPLDPLPEPPTLEALKVELGRRWPMTGLLDILKEADLRIGFTDAFATAARREAVDRIEVQRRLLLCLYGLGTNAGLKRLSGGHHGVSYKELLHTRRRYIDKDSLATRPGASSTPPWPSGTPSCGAKGRRPARPTASSSAPGIRT